MKRLVRKASSSFFHGTCVEYLEGITSSGALMPNASEGAGKNINHDGSKFGGYVFLATTLDKALAFANYIPPFKTEAHVVIEMMVPEERLLPDDDDCPECLTWQDSANSIQQIKIDGEVQSSNFTNVYFYNKDTGEMVLQTSFSNWQQDFEQNRHLFE